MATQTAVFAIILLVVVPLYTIYKPPKFVISYFQNRFPEVLFQVQTDKKIVALTIDDTPSIYTNQILDILKENEVSATFFVIGGQVPGDEHILTDIVRAGSELGNHAMHDEPSISLPSAVLDDEIHEVDRLINSAYSEASRDRQNHFFRPGSGVFSRRILDVATTAGYRTILGSIYPHDPFINVWRLNAWHILSMLRPGAVIICHDRRSWTVPMLKKVVPAMKKKGYEVVSLSKFLEMSKP
ncbi:carbohydrate esterase family 4 protein [Zasmidium cellare ATCC 36951]|uniref:chitin deacetylase n=1 Tax=Zasmidium cellare ATCC 36951 TaxID=1080233 RepID=A0A6A6CWT7_ZASCE|nr:carbohydrate esterase family 4 protein [Zasmidium cellare ATCC 36951]KAF2170269.1 carbohydrate esterase family 4 protein [Zasmidium cellare ATCC 36951]